MGEAMGPLAAVSSIASAGFQMGAIKEQAAGQAAALSFESQQELLKSRYEGIAAKQTEAAGYAGVAKKLGAFHAEQGAMHLDPSSPTQSALFNALRDTELNKVAIAAGNIKMQQSMDEQAALYHSQLAAYTSTMGDWAAMGKGIGALTQGILSFI